MFSQYPTIKRGLTTCVGGLAIALASHLPTQAATFTITSGGGTNASSASGTITDIVDGVQAVVASFTLTQSGKTGYGNHTYSGGSNGIGVDHIGSTSTADDTFSYNLLITPLLSRISKTSILVFEPNPYQQRNYGPDRSQSQSSMISASWTGGALGTISDPNNNLTGLSTGDTVASGFTTSWNMSAADRAAGDWSFAQTNWSLLVGTESLTYSFATPGETFAEGIAFDARFEYAPIPEHSSLLGLLAFGTLGLGATLKQKRKGK